ncbi:hypothetical protein CPB85DRAFT_1471943, partial [Mucidula mucida]
WHECRYVVSESQEECYKASWAQGAVVIGRIVSILLPEKSSADMKDGIVVLDVFQVSSERDQMFGMPILTRRHEEKSYYIIQSKDIKFKFNVQHDCETAKCAATGVRKRKQERQDSDITENYIVHQPVDRFFINIHAFHNAHLVRAALPRGLTQPIPISDDRKALHFKLASQLREKTDARKAAKRLRGNSQAKGRRESEPIRTKEVCQVVQNARARRRTALLQDPHLAW